MIKPIREIDIVKITAQKLSHKSFFRKDYKNFFKPIDYVRTAEIPAVLSTSKILQYKSNNLRVLDISSPQILSAILANYSKSWSITYCNPFEPELQEMAKIKNTLALNNIEIRKIDITKEEDINSFKNKFDYIFSSSVIEHIHPEYGGDIIAVRNINKLLTNNGLLILSVPFYHEAFNEYKSGDVYFVKGNNDKNNFFQRFYDEKKLNDQIIIPSGLSLDSILYIGEEFYFPKNIQKRLASKMQSKLSSILFGKSFFILSNLFFKYSENYSKLTKPYIVSLALRKKS